MVGKHLDLCYIIPPYILRRIAENGTADQQALAMKTLQVTTAAIQQREAIATGTRPLVAKTAVPGENRAVYDCQHGTNLPGLLVRREGDPPVADPAVNEAYDGAGLTYDFYNQIFNRNSIDNAGMRIDSSVHYDVSFDNAFWDGEQMVYGDGDEDLPPNQRLFNRFTVSLDVIGHELTHGVMQYEDNLDYQGQSGALNEHFSDVFGSLVKQRARNQTADQADWIIGEGLFTANVNGVGVRSMKAPGTAYNDPVLGKDPQPDNMSGYVNTTQDNGGVHINSGIPNRAFYLAATQIGGFAWEKAGRIWYATMAKRLPKNATFPQCATTTWTIAGELYGANSLEQQAVLAGWQGVGVTVDTGNGNGGGGGQNQGCLPALMGLFRPRGG